MDATYQSLVQFFIPYYIYSTPTGHFNAESTIGIMTWGTIVTAGCLLSTFMHLSVDTKTWTWIHFVTIVVSYFAFLLIGLVTNILPSTGQAEYWSMEYMMTDLWSYLTVILVGVLSVLPRLVIILLADVLSPTESSQLRRQLFHRKRKNSGRSLTIDAYY